ncbi:hypothetical protein FISHEDRAFT_73349 [Fistulina hepatica ATCC 64428]|uniref:Uncharacterized protein n=1 Tax=Fistulina hepatica ATCC 64428 TaxID=1128425 RepID=A0A0D7AE97_9AGAR|nr:hypothetical protein FISHEDRAFT_73349 [Fistulina hepatica ATCC 64428]
MSFSSKWPENVCEWLPSALAKWYGDQCRARIKAGVLEMDSMKDGVIIYLNSLSASLIDEDLITMSNMSFIPFPPVMSHLPISSLPTSNLQAPGLLVLRTPQ